MYGCEGGNNEWQDKVKGEESCEGCFVDGKAPSDSFYEVCSDIRDS